MTTSKEQGQRIEAMWRRAYAAQTADELAELYGDWAHDYDADHEAIGFFAHETAAKCLASLLPDPARARVLDAGAGTGAVGRALAARGFSDVAGVDASAAMLGVAEATGAYGSLDRADLSQPLDMFPSRHFDAAIAVGLFSYGQAPAHAVAEIVRVVRPGGVLVVTVREDFFREDAMGFRSQLEAMAASGQISELSVSEALPYLPKKDPEALFRARAYRVHRRRLEDADFVAAADTVFSESSDVYAFAHHHIWDARGSRLYDAWIEEADYYLIDAEESIIRTHAPALAGTQRQIVELGSGSARKIGPVLAEAVKGGPVAYVPIDLSESALMGNGAAIQARFGDAVAFHPRVGTFFDELLRVPDAGPRRIIYFGSSVGNFETIRETQAFLSLVRRCLRPEDRFVLGVDLHKDAKVLEAAYNAGPANRSFFLNIVRRLNDELGGNFHLPALELDSKYVPDNDPDLSGTRSVHFLLRNTKDQHIFLSELDRGFFFPQGAAIRVGISRKFALAELAALLVGAGLRIESSYTDERGYFSENVIALA